MKILIAKTAQVIKIAIVVVPVLSAKAANATSVQINSVPMMSAATVPPNFAKPTKSC